jgi:hypothetical protein
MSYDVNACQGIFYCDEEQTIMKESERKRETIGSGRQRAMEEGKD